MNKRFVLSLIREDNDYQREQAASAEQSAARLGVDLQILYAQGDASTQGQQLLQAIYRPQEDRPDAILFQPVGTGLAQLAAAAATAGIGWAVINRDVDYIPALRQKHTVPVFGISSDHREIGRIQGRQLRALLPEGGLVLYIEGPSFSVPAKQRTSGIQETKPANVQIRSFRADWTEDGAFRTVSAWLGLATSRPAEVKAVAAQNDSMARGAKKALQNSVPYLGCDGLPQTGAAWVRSGLLTGTIVVPPCAGRALEMMLNALETSSQPAEQTMVAPQAYPAVEELTGAKRAAAHQGQ